jgi:TatD DNase family protein
MIDTHAHLDQVENLDRALEDAAAAGVGAVVAVGEGLPSNIRNLEISRRHTRPVIYPAFGFHPGRALREDPDPCVEFIRAHAAAAVAIGEIGLDFWYPWAKKDESCREEQRKIFRAMLGLAREYDLPAVIHSRGAWAECLALAREAGVTRAVFHWYSGPLDVLEQLLAAGYYVSCSPSLAYSGPAREAVRHTPAGRLLVETDAPVYYRDEGGGGFTAEPKDVFRTLRLAGGLKDLGVRDAEANFDRNARELFRIE